MSGVVERLLAAAPASAASDPEQALAAVLGGLLDASPLGLVICDRALHVDAVSRSVAAITGAPSSVGVPIGELVPGSRGLALIAASVRDGGAAVIDHELARPGQPPLLVTGFPIRAAGEVVGVGLVLARAEASLLFARATEAVAAEHRLTQIHEQILSTTAHELRAPIASLLLWEKILRTDADDPVRRNRALDAIQASAQAQARLVDDLLDVVRATSGKLRVDRAEVSIAELLGAVLDAFAPRAAEHGISVVRALAASLGVVQGDRGRLRQVLDNLLTNALASTPRGGQVAVSARLVGAADAGRVEIEIADTGCGIAPELVGRVFEPFFHRSADAGHGGAGLGLGLSIARELVELHGGTLRASSAGVGEGATFSVSLPAVRASAPAPAPGDVAVAAGRLSGLRLLLIEDDDSVREALVLLLASEGAEVEAAGRAEPGYDLLVRTTPQLLLSDLALPGTDGYTLMRRIRRDAPEPMRSIPAIAVSAFTTPADQARALEAGFDACLPKPLDFEHLVATVVSHLLPPTVAHGA